MDEKLSVYIQGYIYVYTLDRVEGIMGCMYTSYVQCNVTEVLRFSFTCCGNKSDLYESILSALLDPTFQKESKIAL